MPKSRYKLKLEARRRVEKDLRAYEELQRLDDSSEAEFRRADKRARKKGVVGFFEMPEETRPPVSDQGARDRAEKVFSVLVCNDDANFKPSG